jgi:hypothetical protein
MGTLRLVYLDNFVWSKIVKSNTGLMSGDEADTYRAALPILQEMVVSQKSILCPVSFTHLAELSTYRNEQVRNEAIALMGTLSQGLCLPWAIPGSAPKRSLSNVIGLFPSGQNLLFLEDMVSGMHPALALCEILQNGSILAEMVHSTVQELNEVLRTRKVPARTETSAEPPNTDANVDEAWFNEVFRLRLADPNRQAEPGDTIDLLNLLYASMTDVAVLDKGHAAMVKTSKLRQFWVTHRIQDLLEHLQKP